MAELKAKNPNGENDSNEGTIEQWLRSPIFLGRLAKILPKHLTSERFAAVALRQFQFVPGLRDCTPGSVLSGFMDAGSLGLEIGMNGEAYLIPYKTKLKDRDGNEYWDDIAQLQIGYLGHMKLAWNSGRISAIEADVVTREEVETKRFEFQRGTSGYLNHKPMEDRELTEKTIAFAYGVVWVKGSDRPIWRVIDASQIKRLRNTGKSANSPAWKNHFDEMAIAKALKRCLKWAPKSREMSQSLGLDDQADAGIHQDYASAKDVAGILPAEVPKTEAQQMMDKKDSAQVASEGPEASAESSSTRSSQESPADPREPELVPAQRGNRQPEQNHRTADDGGLGF